MAVTSLDSYTTLTSGASRDLNDKRATPLTSRQTMMFPPTPVSLRLEHCTKNEHTARGALVQIRQGFTTSPYMYMYAYKTA